MPLGMILSLRLLIHMNPCNGFDAANVVKPFPLRSGSLFCLFLPTTYAAYVTGLMLWVSGIEGQSFPTAINHAYPWMTRGWYHICYFHNSCKKHWTFAGHIQPVYNNHSLDFEFETKSNLCRFVQYQTTMINIVPSHGNFHSQGFWNDWCWCFQKWWSPITKGKPVYFGVPFLSFYCRRSLRDNFPINYWTIRYHAVFACMINCTYCIHILWYCLNFDYIYIVHEWISFNQGQVFLVWHQFYRTVQRIIQLVEAKGGRHVGEADLPPSCCEADLRRWSLAGGLQCYDTSASDGAIGAWRRLGWTNDVFCLGVSRCTMMPSHTI